MRLEIEIPDDWKERFAKVRIPPEQCGPTMEERILFWIDHQLCHAEAEHDTQQQVKLYQAVGLPHPREDDGPSF